MTEPTLFDGLAQQERERAREESDRAKREAGLRGKGVEQRDEGIQRGASKANPDWSHAARAAIEKTARELPEFIVDHVFERMCWAHAYGKPEIKTTDQRAMGALILSAARAKMIAPTEKYIRSFNPTHHACPRRVWRSLIFGRK